MPGGSLVAGAATVWLGAGWVTGVAGTVVVVLGATVVVAVGAGSAGMVAWPLSVGVKGMTLKGSGTL